MKTALSIGAGPQQVPVIRVAKKAGWRVSTWDRDKNAPGHRLGVEPLYESTWEPGNALGAWTGAPTPIGAVLCRSSGPPVANWARVCEHFGIPGPSVDGALECLQKWKTRALANALGIPTTRLSARGWCVVRPSYPTSSGAGIQRVTALSPESYDALAEASSHSRDDIALQEAYIEGDDVTLLAVTDVGKVSTVALVDGHNSWDAEGRLVVGPCSVPSKWEGTGVQSAMAWAARTLADALKLVRCCVHCNFRVDAQQVPRLLEVHLDIGGDRLLDELLPMACGSNVHMEFIVRTLLGEGPEWDPPELREATV